MLIYKGFQYRVYPTDKQIERLSEWENALRFLWNLALEQRLMDYSRPKVDRHYLSAYDQMKDLKDLRAELPWLAEVPRNVCAQLLDNLDKAWKACFKKTSRAPKFKRKNKDQVDFTEPHPKYWKLKNNLLYFPKLGNLRSIIHRPLEGKPKSCTLKRYGDQWFASIICEINLPDPIPRHNPTVAIDRGVINLVADSDGNTVESPRFYKKSMERLARAQRRVNRRVKGSKNREKAKNRVMRLHRKTRRQRMHFIHQISSTYSKSHGTVVVEKLNIAGMTRSARGTVESPGKNVQAKAGLNRGILDAGWGQLAYCLKYKLEWTGGRLIEVPAAHSSQECSVCSHIDSNNRLSQARFYCTKCGFTDHADLNAAKVLKSRANRSVLPVEDPTVVVRRSRKRNNAEKQNSENSSSL